MIALRPVIAVAAASLLLSSIAAAQSVRGSVVDRGDTPVPGVVVQLLDSTSAIAARALSNERGEFHVAAARTGTYSLRTLRIGYRPETSPTFVLAAGQELVKRIPFTAVKFTLDTVRVITRNVCKMAGDSAAATFAVWEQVRAALNATLLTSGTRTIGTTTVVYDRLLEPDGRRIAKQRSAISADYVSQPWTSPNTDSLRKTGYVVVEGNDGSATYYAPGLDMLASTAFIEDHCFHLTAGADITQIGVTFEPTPGRRRVSEIKGTLFLDRQSSQLRRLEFHFVNVDVDRATGGDMQFAAMKDGMWVISSWNIRMPVFARVAVQRGPGELRVAGIQVTGGELSLAFSGTDTLWSRPGLVFAGSVVDSVSGFPVPGARVSLLGALAQGRTDPRGRFSIPSVLPGEYTVEVQTPSLDTVSASHRMDLTFTDAATPTVIRVPTASQIMTTLCGVARAGAPGAVLGSVALRGDSVPPKTVNVFAEWTEISIQGSGASTSVTRPTRWIETRTSPSGEFRLCGVPVNTALTLKVEADTSVSASAEPVMLSIPVNGRFARASLVLDPAAPKVAVFAGVVLTDSTKAPLANVEVTLPELNLSTLTNARGEFRLRNIPPGTHRVLARRLGFGPADGPVTFAAYQTLERQIILGRVTALGEIKVMAANPFLREFEDNRRMGFGHFYDRSQLAMKEQLSVAQVLTEFPGVKMVAGHGSYRWIVTNKAVRGANVIPDHMDQMLGAVPACYSDVFVNGHQVYSGRNGEKVFDLNMVSVDQIEAIEFYANRMQTPGRYATARNCGALVITMRR